MAVRQFPCTPEVFLILYGKQWYSRALSGVNLEPGTKKIRLQVGCCHMYPDDSPRCFHFTNQSILEGFCSY